LQSSEEPTDVVDVQGGASIAAKCPYLVDHVADVHPLSS
jgi:hypothetical protein